MILLQYTGAVLGVIGMGLLSLAPNRILLALLITALSCVVMGAYGFVTDQYGIAAAQTIYFTFNVIGLYTWRKVNVKHDQNTKDKH